MISGKLQSASVSVDDPAWNLANAVFQGAPFNSYPVVQDSQLYGIHIKPDGTKMYVTGNLNNSVFEYDLSTAWQVGTASYVQSFSVSTQDVSPVDVYFKPDGTKMYILGAANKTFYEYALSTAWDISTASYVTGAAAISSSSPMGFYFSPDGTKIFVADGTSGGRIYGPYTLSTAWDISTRSAPAASYTTNVSPFFITAPADVFFRDDGLRMYILNGANNNVAEYLLQNPFSISPSVYVSGVALTSATASGSSSRSLFITDAGTKLYVTYDNGDSVKGFDLSTAWQINTTSFTDPTTDYFSVAAQETSPYGVFFKPDGTKMYVIGTAGDDVNEYDLSTAWGVSTASYLQSFSVAAQDATPVDVFFKPDGTKMYVIGLSNDSVYEYNLSTAWNISTASYVQSFSVTSQDTLPYGVFFKPDGTKMYVIGITNDSVYEYNLSTAWNISTASYVQSLSVAAQDATPVSLFFKPDGTKMYVLGASNDFVSEYDLSTAWDISTASYLQNFSVTPQDVSPYGLFFRDDGTKMFIIGVSSDAVWAFNFV